MNSIILYCQAGALNALYLGNRGYKVDVYESKEGMGTDCTLTPVYICLFTQFELVITEVYIYINLSGLNEIITHEPKPSLYNPRFLTLKSTFLFAIVAIILNHEFFL